MNPNNDFLPEGYEAPIVGGNYMKLKDGENKFRILSKPIIGWLDWDDKKPMRFQMNDKPKNPVDATKPIKHFWAMLVWDYKTNQISILEITQSSIQKAITSFINDEDWGKPYGYDIKINRKGEKKETEYTVNPVPHKPITDEMKKAFAEKKCSLTLLFKNEDPFSATTNLTQLQDVPF